MDRKHVADQILLAVKAIHRQDVQSGLDVLELLHRDITTEVDDLERLLKPDYEDVGVEPAAPRTEVKKKPRR